MSGTPDYASDTLCYFSYERSRFSKLSCNSLLSFETVIPSKPSRLFVEAVIPRMHHHYEKQNHHEGNPLDCTC
jgi:hypothetical protein